VALRHAVAAQGAQASEAGRALPLGAVRLKPGEAGSTMCAQLEPEEPLALEAAAGRALRVPWL